MYSENIQLHDGEGRTGWGGWIGRKCEYARIWNVWYGNGARLPAVLR